MEGKNYKERLRQVKAFVFDIDGVLTDGQIHFLSEQGLIRSFNAKDGYAIEQAVTHKYLVAILSRARDPHLRDRFLKLGLQEVYLGCMDKEETLKEFATVYDLALEEILYMGDDVPDLGALRRCGVPTCPNDAAAEVRDVSVYISPFDGGKGCVRDVISQVLRLNGQWTS